jgi:hypothetical protein
METLYYHYYYLYTQQLFTKNVIINHMKNVFFNWLAYNPSPRLKHILRSD